MAITNVNKAPTLVANEIITVEGFLGDIGQISIQNPDAGDELTLSITGGSAQAFFSVDPTSGTINQQTSLSPGVYTLKVLLSDADGMSTNATLLIRIVAEPDLGTANNTQDNTETYQETLGTAVESENTQIEEGTRDTVRTAMDAIGQSISKSELIVAEPSDESLSEALSDPSAIGDSISTLFAASAFNEFDSILDGTPYTITLTPYMLDTLSSMPADIDAQQAQERIELIHKAGKAASIILSVGFVSWLMASGSLMATAMSTPLWRGIDPVAVLGTDSSSE